MFHFARGSEQANMIIDADATWTPQLDQKMVGTKTTTHRRENLMSYLTLGEPNDYKIFCSWMIHRLMSFPKLLTLLSLKGTLM